MIRSIVALEFYPAVDEKSNEKKAIKVGKITAIVMLVFGVAGAPLIANLDLVYTYVMNVSTYMTPPIGICYLRGRFTKRVNHLGGTVHDVCGDYASVLQPYRYDRRFTKLPRTRVYTDTTLLRRGVLETVLCFQFRR